MSTELQQQKQVQTSANDDVDVVVDDTPLSPSSPGAKSSLERQLAQRPEAQDLKNRHILLDTNAAP